MTPRPFMHRPRLLVTAAAIMVGNGGGRVRPLDVAIERETALESARTAPPDEPRDHSYQAHVAALADLMVSIAAHRSPRPHLTLVK